MNNLLKTRTYKERAQPAAREALGLLEKHKDYVLRAKDYHKKKDALRVLKEKAAFKNPDEYYFGMAKTNVRDGVHRQQQTRQPSPGELAVFKKDDSAYLAFKRTAEGRKVERLSANLHGINSPLQSLHTVFADSCMAVKAAARRTSGHGRTLSECARRSHLAAELGARSGPAGRPGSFKASSAPTSPSALGARGANTSSRTRTREDSELAQRRVRHQKMGRALERIATERALQGTGRRKKLAPQAGAPRQYKWRAQRKG